MAIKILMELEGDDVVVRKLDDIEKKGESVGKAINNIGKETGASGGIQRLVQDFQKAGLQFDQASEKSTKFGTSLRVLSSGLRLVGIDIGNVGAAARLLNTTLAGAGVAIAGGAVIALGLLEEKAKRTQGALADIFGSDQKGKQALDALKKSAEQFGTSVDDLLPGLTALQTGLNNVDRAAQGFVALKAEDLPFAISAPDVNKVTTAFDNFIKALRAGRQTQEEAGKTAATFFNTFKDGGPVTSAALRNLPVGTLELIKDALGAAGQSSKQFFAAVDAGAVPLDRLVAALNKAAPAINKAFDSKAVKTMGDELGKVFATLNQGFAKLSGLSFSGAVVATLSSLNEFLKTTNQELQAILDKDAELKGSALLRLTGGLTTGPSVEQAFGLGAAPFPTPEQAGKAGGDAGDAFTKGFTAKAGFVSADNSLQKLGATGIQAGGQIVQGMNQASAAISKVGDQANQTEKDLANITIGSTTFKGRLGQIPVFHPQLAGEGAATAKAGDDAGKTFGTKWVEAAESEIKADFNLEQAIPVEQRQIKPVLSIEELEADALAAGSRLFTKLKEGIDQQPPPQFPGILNGLEIVGTAVTNKAQQIWDRVKQIIEQQINFNVGFTGPLGTFTGGGAGEFLAGGGQVRGSGSTTSDSILAFLSNREFVVNAKAVDFYGSSLFAALNSMRLPRGFVGGAPKFAEGGKVNADTRSLTLVLNDKRFGVSGSKQTVDDLEREASLRGLAMIGRAPSWIR